MKPEEKDKKLYHNSEELFKLRKNCKLLDKRLMTFYQTLEYSTSQILNSPLPSYQKMKITPMLFSSSEALKWTLVYPLLYHISLTYAGLVLMDSWKVLNPELQSAHGVVVIHGAFTSMFAALFLMT